MRKLLFFFLMLSSVANAQLSKEQLKELENSRKKLDTINANLNQSINNSIRRMDSVNMENFSRQNERNLNAFMAERREQEKKAKQRMYLRIGFGVLMLVVLIIGWRRKKKQQVQ